MLAVVAALLQFNVSCLNEVNTYTVESNKRKYFSMGNLGTVQQLLHMCTCTCVQPYQNSWPLMISVANLASVTT